MTFVDLTIIFVRVAKLNFNGEKRVQIFVKNSKFRFLSKMQNFFFGFSIVVQANQGVQLKDRQF